MATMRGDNVFSLPATATFTPEQALQSAIQCAEQGLLKDVAIIGVDVYDGVFIRSSRMDRKMALWLSELLRQYATSP